MCIYSVITSRTESGRPQRPRCWPGAAVCVLVQLWYPSWTAPVLWSTSHFGDRRLWALRFWLRRRWCPSGRCDQCPECDRGHRWRRWEFESGLPKTMATCLEKRKLTDEILIERAGTILFEPLNGSTTNKKSTTLAGEPLDESVKRDWEGSLLCFTLLILPELQFHRYYYYYEAARVSMCVVYG